MPTIREDLRKLSLEVLLTKTLRSFAQLYGANSPQVGLVRHEIDLRLASGALK